MGVEKYRSGEEMNAAPVATEGGHGFERFLRHCARLRAFAPPILLRGVFKFSSIEEAEQARHEENMRASRQPHRSR